MPSRRSFLAGTAATALTWPRTAPAGRSSSGRGFEGSHWMAAMDADPGELDLSITRADVQGVLPPALQGQTLVMNGPARMFLGGRRTHPFDGHGYVRALRFGANGLRLRARFVETAPFTAEQAAQGLIYRGLATNPSDVPRANRVAPAPKNVANTTVTPWGGQLLAGWEGGLPHALDPRTLETLGPVDFGGVLADQAVLAHMKLDRQRDRLITVSPTQSLDTQLTFREFGADHTLASERSFTLRGAMMVHDFAITDRYYVIGENALTVDLKAFLRFKRGTGTMMEAIASDSERDGAWWLIPRHDPQAPAVRIPLDRPMLSLHYANAYDQADGRVVVDSCTFEEMIFGQEFGYVGAHADLDPFANSTPPCQSLQRTVIDPRTATATELPRSVHAVDFPRIHPDLDGQPSSLVATAGCSVPGQTFPFDMLALYDLADPLRPPDCWKAPPGTFVGEPVLAGLPGSRDERETWVIVALTDGVEGMTHVCVFDPNQVASGPVATIRLPELLPYAFHGAMIPA